MRVPKDMIFMKKLTLVIFSCLLSSCATMSTKECKNANWRDIGYSDATKGFSIRLSGHTEACAKVKIRPNRSAYMGGYNRGSREFCTYQSGLKFGKRGGNANNICTAPSLKRKFFRGYNKGKRIYNVEKEIDKKESEIKRNKKEIKDIKKKKVKDSDHRIYLLRREITSINRGIDLLRRELRDIVEH